MAAEGETGAPSQSGKEHRRLICFTIASLAAADFLTKHFREHGDPRANRSSTVRRALRALVGVVQTMPSGVQNIRQPLEHIQRIRMIVTGQGCSMAELDQWLGVVEDQLRALADPADPETS